MKIYLITLLEISECVGRNLIPGAQQSLCKKWLDSMVLRQAQRPTNPSCLSSAGRSEHAANNNDHSVLCGAVSFECVP